MQDGQRITPFITFEKNGKQAVDFYVSIFKNSTINSLMVMPGGDQLLHASFTLDGMKFMAMDAGPEFNFARGSSLFVTCQDQAEVVIIALWIAAQRVALERNKGNLVIDDFKKAAATFLAPVAPAVAAFRSKDPVRMSKYEDLMPRDGAFWSQFWNSVLRL